MTRVLLLTASFGDGHKLVAKALSDEFRARNVETVELDGFRSTNAYLSKWNEFIYEWTTRYTPAVYGASYRWTARLKTESPLWNILGNMSKAAVLEALDRVQPDAVLQLFPDHSLASLRRLDHKPYIGVVITDYSVHSRWFHKNVDTYFFPHEVVANQAKPFVRPESTSVVSGIPIRREFWQGSSDDSSPDRPASQPYILFAAGGRGVFADLSTAIESVREAFPNHTVYVMCGRNEKMLARVQQLGKRVDDVIGLPFVNNVADWLWHADLAIIKSGGVTVTECLATGCPVIAYRPQPGQELDNAHFVRDIGAGTVARNASELKMALHQCQTRVATNADKPSTTVSSGIDSSAIDDNRFNHGTMDRNRSSFGHIQGIQNGAINIVDYVLRQLAEAQHR